MSRAAARSRCSRSSTTTWCNSAQGLKFQQGELTAAQAVDLSDSATAATYATNKLSGLAANKAVIDTLLDNATPGDPADDMGTR